MGTSNSHFTQEELQEYSDLTFFSKKEVLHVFKRFCSIGPEVVGVDRDARVDRSKIAQIPELRVNPFKDRICHVFSTAPDKDGSLNFEDFLDMMSVFSDQSPKAVKVEYAFKIYDFNEDDLIDADDLENILHRLTGTDTELSQDEVEQLVANIMQEADLDDDQQLSFAEFDHVISKSPDFLNSFRIRL